MIILIVFNYLLFQILIMLAKKISLLTQIVFDLTSRIYVIENNSGKTLNSLKLLTICDGFLISINFHTLA